MAHMQVIPHANSESLNGVAKKTIVPGSTIKTDGWTGYNGLKKEGYNHEPAVQGDGKNASVILPWVHIIVGNFKRWVLDAFHGVSPIGSGVVEAACKTLATQRMKMSGMSWGNGKQTVLTIRSLQQSERWENAWNLIASSFVKPVEQITKKGNLRLMRQSERAVA